MNALLRFVILCFMVIGVWLPASHVGAASVAVFPLQELGEGRNDANLPLTRMLVDELVAGDNEVVSLRTVIRFMAKNRIRGLGHLETPYMEQVRQELGASFILLGTVSQRRERPEPSLGLTLELIRTVDQRPVWSYIGSLSRSDGRRILGIGEPQAVEELQPILLTEMMATWPWQIINQAQQTGTLRIEMAQLEPKHPRPGDAIFGRVQLREQWRESEAPRIFFRADEQLYPATLADDGRTWESSWISGPDSGKHVVTLVVEWPDYGRTETALLGSYLVDGTPPVLTLEVHDAEIIDERPVFNREVVLVPRLLVRKALSRWRLSFFAEAGNKIGSSEGSGPLPGSFIWSGMADFGRAEDGVYQVVMEVWDMAGNSARAEQWVEYNRTRPGVAMAVEQSEQSASVDLEHEGKIPLELWRMEMWTSEGKVLARHEGAELPIKIELELAGAELDATTRGFVFVQDVLGNEVRRDLTSLLPDLGKKPQTEAEMKDPGQAEKWVDEF